MPDQAVGRAPSRLRRHAQATAVDEISRDLGLGDAQVGNTGFNDGCHNVHPMPPVSGCDCRAAIDGRYLSSTGEKPWLLASTTGSIQYLHTRRSLCTCTCLGSWQSKLTKNSRIGWPTLTPDGVGWGGVFTPQRAGPARQKASCPLPSIPPKGSSAWDYLWAITHDKAIPC